MVYTYSEFFEFDDIITISHIGASTAESRSRSGVEAVETVFAVLDVTGESGRTCDSILDTPGFVDLAAEANAYYDGSERCCFEDGFDLVDLHVSIVRLSVDPKYGTTCDKDVSAHEEMVPVDSRNGVRFHW